MVATLRLRSEKLKALRRIAGLDTDKAFAERLEVDPSTLSRVLKGTQAPGARFIAGLVMIFGVDMLEDLIEVRSDDEAAA